MIGVIVSEKEVEPVIEFFELFKTPWEFYTSGRNYNVLLSTKHCIPQTNQKLTILFSSDEDKTGLFEEISAGTKYKNITANYESLEAPIYGNLLTFKGKGQPILFKEREVAGLKINRSSSTIIILGYDLFKEVHHLLSVGQPKEKAHIPTLDIHISLLRNMIKEAGIPLVEIPPTPPGYEFMACLTHDIDFAGIREHTLDHTTLGFIYRASIWSLARYLMGKLSLRNLMENWSAVIRLPLVYLGVAKDFWLQFDAYADIEREFKSTFFFIPFKNRQGNHISPSRGRKRATQYDISNLSEIAKELRDKGFEIGVHGIDAWVNLGKARQERDRILEYFSGEESGVRIHWLLMNNDTFNLLEEAGFSYDSTIGYNEAIGYRAGTQQVFKPFGVKRLLELPLHIQDTALFFPKRMNLSNNKALELCERVIRNAKSYHGVVTTLWHDRSLGPERLWKEFYINLLDKIKEHRVFFAPAGEIVKWFRRRRTVKFKEVCLQPDRIKLILDHDGNNEYGDKTPSLVVRLHYPKRQHPGDQSAPSIGNDYTEVLLNRETFLEVPFTPFSSNRDFMH